MHALAEVAARRGHDQVEVVRHDRIGVQLPAEALDRVQKGLQEDLLGRVGLEDRLTELGAIVDMVGALVGDESSTTCHGPSVGLVKPRIDAG